MYVNLTHEQKVSMEKPASEFSYETELEVRIMKKLKSETRVRAFHVKVAGADYNITQIHLPRLGETLYAYKATRSGRIENWKPIFEKAGHDHLMGVEYLVRHLEGQDISKLNLSTDPRYSA